MASVRPSSSHRQTPVSAQLYARAMHALAAGVSHPNRHVQPYPIYIDRAQGSRKWDVDGNEYVDFAMGSCSLLLGHAHPDVVAAIREQAGKGTHHAACHALEVEWAELVREMVPSVEQIRFVASGTEASMLAVRLARAFTGKSKILRFNAHYNGWHDYVILGVLAPYDRPPSLGIPPAVLGSTIISDQNAKSVEEILSRDQDVAAIICEASGPAYGSVPLSRSFLHELRALAHKYHVILIFDEVITGFRWSPGGLQALAGVTPDLTIMAKILTGGTPGGAVGGRKDIMRLLDPAVNFRGMQPAVFHRGTFNAAPICAAAAVTTLKLVRTGEPQRLADAVAANIRDGMRQILKERGVRGAVYGESSTFHVFFGEDIKGSVEGLSPDVIRGLPKETVTAYQNALRKRGVDFLSYMGGVASSAHTDEDVARALEAFDGTIQELLNRGMIEHL